MTIPTCGMIIFVIIIIIKTRKNITSEWDVAVFSRVIFLFFILWHSFIESGLQCIDHRLKVPFWLHAKCPANDAVKCPTGIPIDAWKKLFMDNGKSKINWALMLLIPSLLLLPPTFLLWPFVSLPDLAWPSWMDSTLFLTLLWLLVNLCKKSALMNLCVRVRAVHNRQNCKCC